MSDIRVQQAKKRGCVIFWQESPLSSQYDPIAEGERLSKTLFDQTKVVFCLGIGPLYHLPLLLKRVEKIILIEPRFALECCLKNDNLIQHFPFLKGCLIGQVSSPIIIIDKNHLSLLENIIFSIPSNIGIKTIQVFDLLKIPSNKKYGGDNLTTSIGRIKKNVIVCLDKREKNLNTERYFSKVWLKNTLSNLEQKPIRLVNYLKIPSGCGLLIASAPSLEEEIEISAKKKIDKLKQKTIFKCALPGVFDYLLYKGIIPDCILSSDASFYNTYHFEAIRRSGLNIPLIVPLSIARQCTKDYLGKVYYFIDDTRVVDLLSQYIGIDNSVVLSLKQNLVNMAGSVVVSGLSIFSLLGVKKIKVIGADFTSTPFKSHALSNTTEELMFSSTKRLKPFENRYHYLYGHHLKKNDRGKWVDRKLSLYKDLFEKVHHHLNLSKLPETLKAETNKEVSPLQGTTNRTIHLPDLLKDNWESYKKKLITEVKGEYP